MHGVLMALFPSTNALQQQKFQYFAYGSNMLPGTMASLRNVRPYQACAAVLPNYRLVFNIALNPLLEPSAACIEACSNSRDSNSNTDDIENRCVVQGVLYELSDLDFARVGMTEAVPLVYRWQEISAYPYVGDGENAGRRALEQASSNLDSVKAYTLVKTKFLHGEPREEHIPPSSSYLKILQQGAAYWNMDRLYQVELSKIKTAKFLLVKDGLAGKLLQAAELFN